MTKAVYSTKNFYNTLRILNSFQQKGFNLITGKEKVGKTTFLLTLKSSLKNTGRRVGIITSETQWHKRRNFYALTQFNLLTENAVVFTASSDNLFFESDLCYWVTENNISALILDHFTIPNNVTLFKFAQILKNLSEQFNIPVFLSHSEDMDKAKLNWVFDTEIQIERKEFYKQVFGETVFRIKKRDNPALEEIILKSNFERFKFETI